MRGAWDAACERAGLPGRWFHDLRRSAVRNMVLAGVPRSTATKLSGHRTEAVFVRYVIQDKEMLDDGVGKLGRFHEATSATPRAKAEKPARIG
jgi:integrase